jgi:CheY-like chemotaxis protein
VSVSTADAGDGRVRLNVADTGIGAEPAALPNLFNPFEQAGRGRESQGLGLGLAICKGIVEAHGGTIAAASEGPGKGMTLTVELPTIADAPESASPDVDATNDPARPLTILLVDDHADTLRAMSRLLRQLEHRVVTADCMRSALAAADSTEFDLLISDVGLPDGTGNALMEELLKRGPVRGIALTGYGAESDIRQTRAAGFCAHLTKPVDFGQMQNAIERGTVVADHAAPD